MTASLKHQDRANASERSDIHLHLTFARSLPLEFARVAIRVAIRFFRVTKASKKKLDGVIAVW